MNEQLQEAVTLLINKAVSGAEKGAAFLEGQLPDYVMQLLMWHGWYSFILFVVGIVVLIVAVIVDIKMFKLAKATGDDDNLIIGWGAFGSLARAFVYLPATIGLLNLTWLKIWLAPKVWLVEYAASLVK